MRNCLPTIMTLVLGLALVSVYSANAADFKSRVQPQDRRTEVKQTEQSAPSTRNIDLSGNETAGHFKFLFENGVLKLQHFSNQSFGFRSGHVEQSPATEDVPLFIITLYTQAQLDGTDKSQPKTLIIAQAPLMYLAEANFTLGTAIASITVRTLGEDGSGEQVEVQEPFDLIQKKSVSKEISTINTETLTPVEYSETNASNGKEVKIKAAILPPDEMLSLTRQNSKVVRAFYFDPMAQGEGIKGYYSFTLSGNNLTVKHFAKKYLRFNSANKEFELTVADYPVALKIHINGKWVQLDTAALMNEAQANFKLPAHPLSVDIETLEPQFINRSVEHRNLVLQNKELGPEIFKESPFASGELIVSEKTLSSLTAGKTKVRFSYQRLLPGLKAYGHFTIEWLSSSQIKISHSAYNPMNWSTTSGPLHENVAPGFDTSLVIAAGDKPTVVSLPSAAFKNPEAAVIMNIETDASSVVISLQGAKDSNVLFSKPIEVLAKLEKKILTDNCENLF